MEKYNFFVSLVFFIAMLFYLFGAFVYVYINNLYLTILLGSMATLFAFLLAREVLK